MNKIACCRFLMCCAIVISLFCAGCKNSSVPGSAANKSTAGKPVNKPQKTTLNTPTVLKNISYNPKTRIISMPGAITAVAFSPDSRYIACASVVDLVKGAVPGSFSQ